MPSLCLRQLGWSFVALALALAGCAPDSLSYTETGVVVTVRDPDRSYAPYRTYALVDEVIDVCTLADSGIGAAGAGGAAGAAGAGTGEDCEPLNHRHDQEIVDSIRHNMDLLGFDEVDPDENPDLMLLAAAVAQESWYVYYPYCDYWYGYCFEYAWSATAVSYPIGTLMLYMASWRDADEAALRVPVIWLGVVSGLMSNSHELDADRIEGGIDQAFTQSRYLGEGK